MTEQDLKKIFDENQFETDCFPFFVECNSIVNGDTDLAIGMVTDYEDHLNKGFSEQWAKYYALNSHKFLAEQSDYYDDLIIAADYFSEFQNTPESEKDIYLYCQEQTDDERAVDELIAAIKSHSVKPDTLSDILENSSEFVEDDEDFPDVSDSNDNGSSIVWDYITDRVIEKIGFNYNEEIDPDLQSNFIFSLIVGIVSGEKKNTTIGNTLKNLVCSGMAMEWESIEQLYDSIKSECGPEIYFCGIASDLLSQGEPPEVVLMKVQQFLP